MTTGDEPYESALWTLDDNVPEVVVGGRSIFRIVQPVFTEDDIYFGTDTPGDQCGIYRMSRATLIPQLLRGTSGPTFFGTSVGGQIVFSTVVEPGHPTNHACLFSSKDGSNFQESLILHKDRWPMRLFQYGQIHMPCNTYPGNQIWFSPCALERDGQLLSLDVSNA
jgi:hypothetical protein